MLTFGERLKELRLSKHIKQTEMANIISISYRTYQDYEYNKCTPKLDKLIFIADYFNVSLDYLVGRTDNPNINK